MYFEQELTEFEEKYSECALSVKGAVFRYVLAGQGRSKTLVFLNGGMNTYQMWMRYVEPLSKDYQVLLFDYPRELKTNQALVSGMHSFFACLDIHDPILVGASDGGMVAQIYTQRYPYEVGGLVLISTGGMDQATLKELKKKYALAPLMLWYLRHCRYEKLKPRLIQSGADMAKTESPEDQAYVRGMFETLFRDYPREKDVHISGLLADLMHQKPAVPQDFRPLAGKILLILPDHDFFTPRQQHRLIELMHRPQALYISGGHMATVLRADQYVRAIRNFVTGL